jgi:hypothetical protein
MMMMMTDVATPPTTPTPGTTLPIPTPVLQDAKSRIAGAKEPATHPANPTPFGASTGDTYTAGRGKITSSMTGETSTPTPPKRSENTPRKQTNWSLVWSIIIGVAGTAGWIAYLAKGGEKAVENLGKQAEHTHPPKTGKSTCTTEGCDHSSHNHDH